MPPDDPASQGTVSVIVPARDAGATLGACLEALARQRRLPDEIVVVDNDSSDRTAEIARAFAAANPSRRVTVAHASGRRGPGPVRNEGARVATGSLLAFVDADCIAPEEWLERLLEPFKRHDVIASAGTTRAHAPASVAEKMQDILLQPLPMEGETRIFRSPSDAVVTGSLAVRADAFRAVGGFDERLCWLEDTAIAAALLRDGKGVIARTPSAWVVHDAPATAIGTLQRAWKYGRWAGPLMRSIWKRKTFVEMTRRIRIDTESLPGRVWVMIGPDKIVAACLALGVLWWPLMATAAVPLTYYAIDIARRARRRSVSLNTFDVMTILALDIAYHAVWTLGRISGSIPGRSLCL